MTKTATERNGLDDRSAEEILSPAAVEFLEALHTKFDGRRRRLVAARADRQHELDNGGTLGFLEETVEVRSDPSWKVPPPRQDYADRRVEITGPTDRKLVINALNSGA